MIVDREREREKGIYIITIANISIWKTAFYHQHSHAMHVRVNKHIFSRCMKQAKSTKLNEHSHLYGVWMGSIHVCRSQQFFMKITLDSSIRHTLINNESHFPSHCATLSLSHSNVHSGMYERRKNIYLWIIFLFFFLLSFSIKKMGTKLKWNSQNKVISLYCSLIRIFLFLNFSLSLFCTHHILSRKYSTHSSWMNEGGR